MSDTKARIVLVEDDRFLRKAMTARLRQRGYTVVTAEDGEEALRVTRAELPDIVLLDLIMPKMQGFEVLRVLKADAATASIPVMVLSNLGQEQDVAQTIEAGAVAYLVKANLSLDELAQRVDEVLAAGRDR